MPDSTAPGTSKILEPGTIAPDFAMHSSPGGNHPVERPARPAGDSCVLSR
jgi:hypothetical protein